MQTAFEGYFPITVLTKPYLRKYLQSEYGNPIIHNNKNLLGLSLTAYFERPKRHHKAKEEIIWRGAKYNDPMQIHLPVGLKEKRERFVIRNEDHIVSLNSLFHILFQEHLFRWVSMGMVYKVQYKKSVEDFCWRHHISIEEDISLDAIIKKERRYRLLKEMQSVSNN